MAEPAAPIPTDLATRGDIMELRADIRALANSVAEIRVDVRELRGDVTGLQGDMRSVQANMKWLLGITGAMGTMLLYVVGNLLVRLIPPH